jgi:hypothetical protein
MHRPGNSATPFSVNNHFSITYGRKHRKKLKCNSFIYVGFRGKGGWARFWAVSRGRNIPARLGGKSFDELRAGGRQKGCAAPSQGLSADHHECIGMRDPAGWRQGSEPYYRLEACTKKKRADRGRSAR